ncbi:hypothetical protein EPO15_18570 [bacterium]|nr:MAG: hypothetical protein EPO15_18570 [bacterium]
MLGRRLKVGDRVRVVGVPDLAGMSPSAQVEFLAALKALRRRPRKVRGFDARGNADLMVRIAGDLHILSLEPGLLEWTR